MALLMLTPRIPSDCFTEIKYDPQTWQCVLVFRKGGQWGGEVPPDEVQKLLSAASPGRYFQNWRLKRFGF